MLTRPSGSSSASPSPDSLAAWRSFLEAHARVTDELSRELREAEGMPLSWYDVLIQLSEAEDHRLRMQALADAVLLSKSGISRLVDRMERAGLVRRVVCETDRRGTMAELTDEGWQRLRATAPTHLDGVRRRFADLLAPDEVEVLTRAMQRIAAQARRP